MKKNNYYWMILVASIVCQGVLLATPIQLEVNHKEVTPVVNPVIENNVTLVPVRIISEHLGAEVTYIPEGQVITIKNEKAVITLAINEISATVNDETIDLEAAPKLIDDTTMVPVRFISEALGCEVDWDGELRKVSITLKEEESIVHTVTLAIKDRGEVVAELYPERAPITVENFIRLSEEGFYDGLTFHRVIENFMIQGGCPIGNGTGGPGYSISGEFSSNGFDNSLLHTPGVLSMARSMHPDSGGSQFFIMTSESPHLDGSYAAFGKVIEGMDVIYGIEQVETNASDKPLEPIVIEGITVVRGH